MRIAAVLMIKNESNTLPVTLYSIQKSVDVLIVFDTGSTDDTLSVLRDLCAKLQLPLFLMQGQFEDFSTSRNKLLDYADYIANIQYIDLLLLLDANDELQDGDDLRSLQLDPTMSGWYIHQTWHYTVDMSYFNIRLIRPNKGWRYKGVVHEYLIKENEWPSIVLPICLFQDRHRDHEKSAKRYETDIRLLLTEHEKNPTDPRTVFYLAQSYKVSGDFKEAYRYYQLRVNMEGGFDEEIYQSHYNLGVLADKLNSSVECILEDERDALAHFFNAYHADNRVEPLLEIALYYMNGKRWSTALIFIRHAIELPYPEKRALFVDRTAYERTRWVLLNDICQQLGITVKYQ